MTTGDRIIVKPVNNIYTALTGIAVLVTLAAVVIVFVRAQQMGVPLMPG